MSKKLTMEIIMTRTNKNPKSIKSLNLWGLKLSDISLLSEFPFLEILSLSENQIKDLSIFKNLKYIRELYLKDNQISDFSQIENLKYCKKLNKLVLEGNPITKNPNYPQKIIEILPQISKLDEKETKNLINNEKNNISPNFRQNLAAPDPGAFSLNLNNNNNNNNDKNINNNLNINNINNNLNINNINNNLNINNINNNLNINNITNNNNSINSKNPKNIEKSGTNMVNSINAKIGNQKISAKTLEVFNRPSFRKKKTPFFHINKNKENNNINDISIGESGNALTTSRIEEEENERCKTLSQSYSVNFYSGAGVDNIIKKGYRKKIIGNFKNEQQKLNQSTCLRYQEFDNEENKREDSEKKNPNKSLFMMYNKQAPINNNGVNKNNSPYVKGISNKMRNSFSISNNICDIKKMLPGTVKKKDNGEEKVKEINGGEKNNNNINNNNDQSKKIMESIKLLISILSEDGVKEVQNEVQKLILDKKNKK